MAAAAFRRSFSFASVFTFTLISLLAARASAVDAKLNGSTTYITRPEIEAPKFHIDVYDRESLAPGYWFVASYDYLDLSHGGGGKWTAPHILDSDGELIWSGAYLSQKFNTFDFRVSNVNGKDMLTFICMKNFTAITMDEHYDIQTIVPMLKTHQDLINMHELHFVDNGTRALIFVDEIKNATKEASVAIGYTERNCALRDTAFREFDVTNDWAMTAEWNASQHLDLKENRKTALKIEWRCAKEWDYAHLNAVDKFADGTYLVSARYTDTIYKIAANGSVIWRFGGSFSDFEGKDDVRISRQHHARIRGHNETHTILSIFDNGYETDEQNATDISSRGLIVALRTDVQPMTATVLRKYMHPDGEGVWVDARGGIEILPNENAFVTWVDGLHHSEHAPNGRMLMQARSADYWLKSYRSYKFPWAGRPSQPPDVHSETIGGPDGNTTTFVHVSWNGATDVATWHLYSTDDRGVSATNAPVVSLAKTGFETALSYDGFAMWVVVEARDREGDVLGKSRVVKTIVSTALSKEAEAQEARYLEAVSMLDDAGDAHSWTAKASSIAHSAAGIFVAGILCGALIIMGARAVYRARRRGLAWWRQNDASYKLREDGEDDEQTQDKEESQGLLHRT